MAINHSSFFPQKYASPLSQNGVITTENSGTLFRHIQVYVYQYVRCITLPVCIPIYYIATPFVQVLLSLSHCLLVHLQSRMEGWDERRTLVGDIFLDLVS